MKVCPRCNSSNIIVIEVNNVHKIESRCKDCDKFIQHGKINEYLQDGQYKFLIDSTEEINDSFIQFKLSNDKAVLKKKIWKDDKGVYFNNLKKFMPFLDLAQFKSLSEILSYFNKKDVLVTVKNISIKNKKVCEIITIDKIR